jgi:transcriptional regulator GlxA family with amidase domain
MLTETNKVKLAIQHMSEQPDCKLCHICKKLNISPRHFRRLFLQQTGMPPKEYQQQLRFKRAVAMLRSGKYHKLSDVAYQCGYYDQTTFNKAFKRMSGGVRPGEFVEEFC